MAYIDFTMRPPKADTAITAAPLPTPAPRARRIGQPRAALWIALGIGGLIAALLFSLAFVAIGEPWSAMIVTTVLLLPAASFFGGDGRRQA